MSNYQLGNPYPGDRLTRTPGMSAIDAAIWRRYFPQRVDRYTELFYNVRVGTGADVPKNIDPKEVLNWWQLTSRRIDIVGQLAQWVDVIEVRHGATPNAIGRLLEYLNAWWQTPPIKTPLRLNLITDFMDSGLSNLCTPLGIRLIEVPPQGDIHVLTAGHVYKPGEFPSNMKPDSGAA